MQRTCWPLVLCLSLLAAVPASAQAGLPTESGEWVLQMYLNVRQQVTNALPDLVVCGDAASGLPQLEFLRGLAAGPRRVVDSLRVLPTCPARFRDVMRLGDVVTLFVSEWPRRPGDLLRARACKWACGHHRLEEYSPAGAGSVRFTVWAVDD